MKQTLSLEAREVLAWKAGLTFTRPLASGLSELQEAGLVGSGDILSAPLTTDGQRLVEAWRNESR